jgi:glycosyltransferase involved in cell wall biosynthesis
MATMESVLSQEVDLEYVVMDGGSTDGSREIIASRAERLAYWESQKDGGQYDAINRGFAKSQGEIMGWLNSSDLYLPWTLKTVRMIFEAYPEIQWITSTMKACITGDGAFENLWTNPGFSARRFYRGQHGGPGNNDFLQQESCFWRRSIWEKIGGAIDLQHASAGDYWLWSRFFQHANVAAVEAPLAAFRFHDEAKSVHSRYEEEVEENHAGDAIAAGKPFSRRLDSCGSLAGNRRLRCLADPLEAGAQEWRVVFECQHSRGSVH